MRIRCQVRSLFSLGAVSWLVLGASAAMDAVTLKPKFVDGRSFYIEMDNNIEQKFTPPGGQGEMKMDIRSLYGISQKVESTSKDKTKLAFRYERILSDFDSPMMVMKYDSDLKKQDPDGETVEETFKAMIGGVVTVELDAAGKVTAVNGVNDIKKKAMDAGGGDPMTAQLTQSLSDEVFKVQMMNDRYGMLPDKPVSPGDKWTISQRETMPMIGTLARDIECKLTSVEKADGHQIATIEYTGKVSTPADAKSEPNQMGMIMKIESGKIEGSAKFDVDAGEFVRDSRTTALSLSMTQGGGEGGKGITMSMNQSIKGTTRYLTDAERAQQKKANAEKPAASAPSKDEKK